MVLELLQKWIQRCKNNKPLNSLSKNCKFYQDLSVIIITGKWIQINKVGFFNHNKFVKHSNYSLQIFTKLFFVSWKLYELN